MNRRAHRSECGRRHRGLRPAPSRDLVLSNAPIGAPLKVVSVIPGCGAQSRLASLGILPGEIVSILQRENGGPVLLEVKGTRVALGRGICSRVSVSVEDEPTGQ